MRNTRFLLFSLVLLIAVTLCPAEPALTPVAPGLTLSCERVPDAPWEVRALRVDRQASTLSLDTALGMGKLKGVETLTKIIARETASGASVVAAVNADFFVMAPAPTAGLVCGMTVRRGELVSTGRGMPAFVRLADGTPRIGVFDTRLTVRMPQADVVFGGLNQVPVKDAVCAYTALYGFPQTECVVVKLAGLPLSPNGVWRGKVSEIVTGETTREAGEGEVLLHAEGAAAPLLAALKPGDPISLRLSTPALSGAVAMAAGGNQILLHEGAIVPQATPKAPRHPRTAVGFNDREIILVTVDGRQAGWSVGMTYVELAELMKRYGCTEALNLDGGGSTTCWAGGKVVNQPSGGVQRQIADAILVRSSSASGK